jgi:hypothetical protein
MSIAGHVSRAMLSRYSHVRMEAKRQALDEIAARQRAADEKRGKNGPETACNNGTRLTSIVVTKAIFSSSVSRPR